MMSYYYSFIDTSEVKCPVVISIMHLWLNCDIYLYPFKHIIYIGISINTSQFQCSVHMLRIMMKIKLGNKISKSHKVACVCGLRYHSKSYSIIIMIFKRTIWYRYMCSNVWFFMYFPKGLHVKWYLSHKYTAHTCELIYENIYI